MRIYGREISHDLISRIRSTIEREPNLSRRGLSLKVCQWMDWRAPNGLIQQVNCRKALLELNRRGLIKLPQAATACFKPSLKVRPTKEPMQVPKLWCTLPQLGQVTIHAVSSHYSKASNIWNQLMDRFHYLGKGPLRGAQIRYLVQSSAHGWLGALAFSSATWRLKRRDEHIGWSEAARQAHLNLVVCNSRFLILPDVHVPNLASHILSLATGHLVQDWSRRYGYAPVLVETFVDPAHYKGTCYQAANWRYVGQTAARTTAYANGKISVGAKDIYLYPLCRDWQQQLCRKPEVGLCTTPRPHDPVDWTEEEFGTVQLFDPRLKQRLYQLAGDFFAQPGELVPQACNGSEAKIKAAYRFFKNANVDMQTLLKSHIESSIERIKSHPVVLAVQDTSSLNYTSHPPVGVGPINTTKDKSVGLVLHDTMALTPDGTPLGLLDVQCWARDPKQAGKRERRHQLPIEEKESIKWLQSYRAVACAQRFCPETMLVSVGDREADIYDLFHEAVQDPDAPKILVRAERSRQRKVEHEYLWPAMMGEPIAGTIAVAVPAKGSQPARKATCQVRFAQVRLNPPKDSKLSPVTVWAAYARETGHGAQVKKPIDWMLLTTVETSDFKQACQRFDWYSRRWGIEVYHRTIKSGCRIQDRRLDHTENLKACLAIDLVVAWRIYWLTMVGRQTPDKSCDPIFSKQEWQVLSAWATGKRVQQAPSVQQITRMIGKLGGWIARSKEDNPGTTTMWRGLARLPALVQGYRLAMQIHHINDDP
jgi:hypothetical protein